MILKSLKGVFFRKQIFQAVFLLTHSFQIYAITMLVIFKHSGHICHANRV